MLKAIVEEMKVRPKFRFGEAPSLVPILANDYRHLQFACYEQWFVTEFLWQTRGIDQEHACGPASVSAREYIELDATRLEQLAQKNHERSLSRSACGEIAHANDCALQPPRSQQSAIIERSARSDYAAVDA